MMKNKLSIPLFIVMTLCHSQTAFSAIFKCVNAQGKTYYNDRACPKNEKETQFRNIKDPKNGYVPPSLKSEHKAGSNNGVVVGSALERDLEKELNNKLDSGRSVKRSSSGASASTSSSNQNSPTSSTKQSIDSSNSNSNSTVGSGGSIIPLKIEEVTVEPKDEVK